MHKEQIENWNNNRGMTLVEVLVVMVILTVVMTAVMSLYIPIQRSTVTQTQVSDVNSNLRLALNVMTRDLLTAGFLASEYPIVFPDADTAPDYGSLNLANVGTENNSEFIIRTRAVGGSFARVTASAVNNGIDSIFQLTVADEAMALKFPAGSIVRVFSSTNGEELIGTVKSGLSSANRAFTVTNSSGSTINVDASVAALTGGQKTDLAERFQEAIVIRIQNSSQPAMQTIHYKLENGILERIVNGSRQFLARNLDSVFFGYAGNPSGAIIRVDLKLTGKTDSEDKVREVQSSVKLRNVFSI